MMYCVDEIQFINPIDAVKHALSNRTNRGGAIYINNQFGICLIKTKHQHKLLSWADAEYRFLQKCNGCSRILAKQTNYDGVLRVNVYCSSNCEASGIEAKIKDNEEIEFYL